MSKATVTLAGPNVLRQRPFEIRRLLVVLIPRVEQYD